jgi:hypothetical protein
MNQHRIARLIACFASVGFLALPACLLAQTGCITPDVNGKAYYLCGNTWFSAAYGANGVYYTVVPTP